MRKSFVLIAIAVIAVLAIVIAFVVNPQDTLYRPSNLAVRGIVTSIEQNHETQGMIIGSYHIFRLFIKLNITEVVWTSEGYLVSLADNDTVFGSNSISVGYDNLDNPQLTIGQEIECKGFYFGGTDSSYSFVLTVSPSVSESYLKPHV